MKCTNCGHNNNEISTKCLSCGKSLYENTDNDYCPDCKAPLLYPNKPCPFCETKNKIINRDVCANCNTRFDKSFLLKGKFTLSDIEKALLSIDNDFNYCEKCYKNLKLKSTEQLKTLKSTFKTALKNIPVLNIDNPQNLSIIKYCKIISARNIVEVDNISESLSKSFDSEFNKKFSYAEKDCLLNLKKQALSNSSNIILGCNIKYKQLITPREMFLVSITGTAAVAQEFTVLNDYEQKVFNLTNGTNDENIYG